MITKLPPPIKIVYCAKCQDVTAVAFDKHGEYCAECSRALDDPRLYPEKAKNTLK